ncbi:hypothetical protein [Ornithinibacillus xuwenensis]|uniref:HMA domain-containing protein n=1 Tax=Ornithinibacillus xuwenensis TaxID=3144668 RepID=A0ABU9XGH4_9BACI
MQEQTFYIKEAFSEPYIQRLEQVLNDVIGVERVLVDTADGEVKIEFNQKEISMERIAMTLMEHDFTILH